MALAAILVAWTALAATFVIMRLRTPAAAVSSRGARSRDARALYGFAGQILAIAVVTLWRRPADAAFVGDSDDVRTITAVVVLLLGAAGAALAVTAMVALGRVWPVGARMPDDFQLVTTRTFGLVRHPVYAAVFLLVVATGLAWSTLEATVIAAWVYGVATHVRAGREEKLLSSALGTGYAVYAARVPRFLPRIWTTSPHAVDREAAFVSIYTGVYLLYLFVYQEGELLHWVSLVLLPVAILPLVGLYRSLTSALESMGLSRAHAARGWLLVLGAGALAVAVQLSAAAARAELAGIVSAPYGAWLPLLAFVLLVCSAATTEEIFFRGLLQTRLANRLRHEWAGWLLASCAFAIYHLPYAWFGASGSGSGRAAEALQLTVTDGLVPGLVIGVVFWKSGRNLAGVIVLHALIDLLPALRVVAAVVHR